MDWRATCIAVSAGSSLAEEEAAVRAVEALRKRRGADLVLWGEVVDAREPAIRIWFTTEGATPDLKARPWRFEGGELEPSYRAKLAALLQALATSAAAPALDRPGHFVADILRPLLPRLRSLLEDPPPGLTPEGRGRLRWTAALGFQTFGDQAGDNAALRQAVALYYAALPDLPRASAAYDWAALQNDLGNALAALGARGDDAALRRAVAAYEAALGERTRERAPLDWAMTQSNLGAALQTLGERGDDGALRRAVRAYEAALEEFRRFDAPAYVAMAEGNLARAQALLAVR
jgi:tetratricopeptide (TPR) repeat protein